MLLTPHQPFADTLRAWTEEENGAGDLPEAAHFEPTQIEMLDDHAFLRTL